MSLVGNVGRRRLRARLAMAMLYLVLACGAVTTLYPFLLMLSTGFKGPTDQNDRSLIPAYFHRSDELTRKVLADKYANDTLEIEASRTGHDASPEAIRAYEAFLTRLPTDHWKAGFQLSPGQVVSRLRTKYQAWLRQKYGTIDRVNRAYEEEAPSFQAIDVPAELLDRKTWNPPTARKYQEWIRFKAQLGPEWRIPITTQRLFQRWAAAKWQNQWDRVPPELRGKAKGFTSIEAPKHGPVWNEFRATGIPARYMDDPTESRWEKVHVGPLPIEAYETDWIHRHQDELRREFAGRNYVYVLDYVLLHGRAVANTLLFCVLSIVTQLLVNPLAAYALSRYPIRATGKILVFLLATMAFPAEVAMIPSFLLLKDLGLLNTFAALVLPSAASGYMVFLLKGFFDSLPQELFEAGQLDGARESTMLWHIALPLSKPVMGYLALLAFMGAYGAFMYAFLVAQDERMWTLMVWIYQLQITAPKATVMAALTLAAFPTLLVFLAAQRVIMRGIVLPGER